MTDDNPYAPPKTIELIARNHVVADVKLASRSARLIAYVVDRLLVNGAVFFILTVSWPYLRPPSLDSVREEGEYFLVISLAVAGLSVLCFLLFQGHFLKKHGQTIGKKLIGIRISDLDGHVPSFSKLILLRYLPLSLLSPIAFTWCASPLSLLDNIFIFRKDRRCIHDDLAGTQVVKVKHSAEAGPSAEME
jgi:uncharacterized RDD family membrane protein YckC